MFVRIILPRERTVTDTDDNPPPLSRRRFLKIMGVTAAGVGIAACKVSPRLAIIRRQAAHKSTHARPARILKRTTHRASAASRPAKPAPAPKPPALANAPVYRGPLSDIELQSLAAVSLPCIALTPEAALAAANRIGIQHPSNMCGPLSAFLLRETGVIAPADPRQFWLLNPRLEYTARMLRRAFPPEQFYKGTFRVPIDQFDFNAFPLYAGDFLFVYAGSKGTFDHVLTVNRVDDEGRAYAISNLNIGKGPNGKDQFIVDEVMLYDPNNPGVGQFYEWTNRRKNLMTGLTGYGGFDLWRRWDTKPIPAAASPEKTQMMLGAVLDQGGQWAAKIKRLGGDVIFSRNADAVSHPASIIKLAVGMLLLAMIESRAKDVQAELRHTFDGGRSYETLLKTMLVNSEEAATDQLTNVVYKGLGGARISDLLAQWGAPHTTIAPRRSSCEDIVNLLEGLYSGRILSPQSMLKLLNHIAEITANDRGRLWALRNVARTGVEIFNKRASVIDPLIVGDAGIVVITRDDGARETYVACILGYADGGVTYEKLEEMIGDCAVAWYRTGEGISQAGARPTDVYHSLRNSGITY